MARIKKYADNLTQNLTYFQTYLVDTNPNSTYFRITEFKESFTGGKNGFLIEGSEHLKESTDIKIEILDVEGNPIYFEPGNGIPEYYEGLSKVVAVYIYEDTPIGNAKITVLGELKTYIDTDGVVQPIPEEWAGIYNLKWERDFNVNRLLSNEDKVRFYVRPQVSITEIVKPIFSNVVTSKTQTGIVNGQALTPSVGQPLTNFTQATEYLLTTVGNTFWTASVVGTYLNIPGIEYSPLVTEVINSREIIVQPPYSNTALGSIAPVENFTNETFTATFNYTEGVDNLKTALTGSFAKITLADLTTFVGDCARVKIFRKSTADLSDFQFVQEIQLESNELLVDLESTTKNQENYGLFDNVNFKSLYPFGYWITSSNNLVTAFNQTFLYNSVKLNSTIGVEKFFTSKSFNISEGIEYTLDFNVKKEAVGNPNNYVEAYLSGSKQTTINGSPTTVQVKQSIVTLKTQNALLQKQNITKNIKAEKINNAKLYFDIKGSDWYIADVSLKASQETAFSPDEITFIQSVPRNLPAETFVYRFEFYDINNNYIPVLVEETKTFDGGNLQTIRKQLRLVASSTGFQFDSGSNPVPPTIITIEEQKTLLTGSVHYTSQSFDFFGNDLSASGAYTSSGAQFPGLLNGIGTSNVFMTVSNFTGSRSDINVQLVKLTGECEGFTDTINIYKILDGFGGVNHIIRPYRGTQIRNSSTASLEIQAVRIDGINDIILSKQALKNYSDIQLHILSRSKNYEINPNLEPDKFVNLSYVTASGMFYGLTTGSLGSKQIDYNAVFDRDSIDFRRTIFLIPSSSNAGKFAYEVSSSVLASIILEDLQDGLDSGVVIYNADSFIINPRTETLFKPVFGFATASFAKRGTAPGEIQSVTSSFQIYPSMSINKDWVPEYWLYYHTQSLDPTLTVVARDENKNIIPSQVVSGNVRSPLNQTKNLTLTFTYTEPWTSASVSLDKTFTIVPEGKQGDESIIFEVNPIAITLGANSRGVVNDFRPSITDIKLKQGARYLAFSSSAHTPNNLSTHGTFYLSNRTFPTASVIEKNVKAGNLQLTSSFGIPYTSSLIISASSELRDLSGSVEYMLVVHPYFTSSIYTASVVVNYTKILEGAPPIQIVISPTSVALTADEVGFVTPVGYSAANTTIQVKEGADFLKLITTESFANADARKGTYTINSIETRGGSIWNIRTGSLASSSLSGLTGTMTYNRFDYPYVSASAVYTIQAYPFALGAGHQPTSSIFTRTQTFTKNVTPPKARSIDFKASSYTVNYDRNGVPSLASQSPIILSATAFNTTASADKVYIVISEIAQDGSESGESSPIAGDSGTNPVTFTLPDVNFIDVGPETIKTFKVKITDGNTYTSPTVNPYRAEAQLTISGIKAGADSYKLVASNESTSITADLWTTQFTGTGMKITTFNGTQQLTNVKPLPLPTNPDDFDFQGDPIGVLGFSSASIFSKSNWINAAITKPVFPSSNPAEIGNITTWAAPAINKSGQIVYRIDFEGDSSTTNPLIRPLARQTQFVTQSIAVQFTPPAPYDIKMTNENSSAVYKVSGEFTTSGTGNQIRVYRGGTELTNTNFSAGTGPDTDAYGTSGLFKDQCRVSILSKSSWLTLPNSWVVSSFVTGVPATMPPITNWTDPSTNTVAEIVYQIECEGRQTLYKTQSLSIQIEGATGPGIVMRGEWNNATDYSGSVETQNTRRDAVIYGTSPVTYYAAISGSGPTTYDNQNNLVNYHAPNTGGDNAWWQYLGEEEFFVAAKIAIFEESFVKNTINIGNNSGSAFANIVLAGGRADPYMAIGQYATIGYDNVGIWLGIYNDGTGPTQYKPRFSLKNATGTNYLRWTGTGLQMAGDLEIVAGATGNASTQAYASLAASSSAAIALTSAANIANLTASAAFVNAVAKTQQLADGAFPGTFISSNFIYSPVVAGVNGYFSNTFKVGNNGITLDGTNKKIYIGTGTYSNLNTSFYVDSDYKFSLGNRLFFDGTNLTIAGSVTADSGYLGGIDGWIIDSGLIRNNLSTLFLDAANNSIYIKTTAGGNPDLILKKGALSVIGGSTVNFTVATISDANPSITSANSNTYLGSGYTKIYTLTAGNGTAINLNGATGTYSDGDIDFSANNVGVSPNTPWSGQINGEFGFDIFTTDDPAGTVFASLAAGYFNVSTFTGGSGASVTGTATSNQTLTLEAGITYYAYPWHSQWGVVISGNVDVFFAQSFPAIQLNKLSEIVELTSEGIQIASGTDKYFKAEKSTSTGIPVLTSKGWYELNGDGTNSTLQIKGTDSGTAINIESAAGQINTNGNNITLGTGFTNWQASNGKAGQLTYTTQGGETFPTVYLYGLYSPGGGTRRGLEISLSNWTIGRDTSCIRHKYDITSWEPDNLLDKILSVPIVNYYWKADKDLENPPIQTGVIAEEVVAAGFEDWVDFDWHYEDEENPTGDKKWMTSGIDKQGLVFVLWKAVQELTLKVRDLESKLNS
jgi:hypothetical protein